MKAGPYTIVYKQIPYKDRCFIVYYDKVAVCQFTHWLWKKVGDRLFWFLEDHRANKPYLPDTFWHNVEQYNKRLDAQNES